jgi:hypothetical protein
MTQPHAKTEDEQQRHVGELLRSFDAAPAPARLHQRIESLVAAHQDSPRRDHRFAPRGGTRRPLFSPLGFVSAGAAAIIAVVAIAIAVGLGGSSHTPSLRQAAAPTLRAATLPAPPESGADHTELTAAVDGVRFPYWGERFGWHSTGTRSDQIDGRAVTTVFYSDAAGRRIGYAILAGTPAPRISGGKVSWHGGVQYRLLTENGASAVVWQRDGHLCVVSGHGVPGETLLRLASWSDRDATAS